MNNNFCCEKFKYRYEADKRSGLNIRILKESVEFRKRATSLNLKLNSELLFFITEGYENFNNTKKILIHFCPFCGTRLEDFYTVQYVQEEIDC